MSCRVEKMDILYFQTQNDTGKDAKFSRCLGMRWQHHGAPDPGFDALSFGWDTCIKFEVNYWERRGEGLVVS
jgi:hypothetical protein